MKFKAFSIFIDGGHSSQDKSMIFRLFASIAGCVRSFTLAKNVHLEFLNFGQNSFFYSNNQ